MVLDFKQPKVSSLFSLIEIDEGNTGLVSTKWFMFLLKVQDFKDTGKIFIFTRFVFIHFLCNIYIDILENTINLELPNDLA